MWDCETYGHFYVSEGVCHWHGPVDPDYDYND